MTNQELINISAQIRRDIVRMVAAVKSGHPGGSLGCADFLTFLYFDWMNHNSDQFSMDARNEDVFFLSNGHISPVWYSALAGQDISLFQSFQRLEKYLLDFKVIHQPTKTFPEYEWHLVPWVKDFLSL